MRNMITYKQTKILTLYAVFFILLLVLLFILAVNATTPAEELVSINQRLEKLDQELSILHKSRNRYESMINAEYLGVANLGAVDVYFVWTEEEMYEIAAAAAIDKCLESGENFISFYKIYFTQLMKNTSKTEQIKKDIYDRLTEAKKNIEKKQNEVFQLRERKQAILSGQLEPIPLTLNECETDKATICGTWTLKDGKYHALWNNGAKAVINIVRFDDETVVFTRHDTTGSSIGLQADYEGKRVSAKRAEGTVKWSWNNNKWSGTWYATW